MLWGGLTRLVSGDDWTGVHKRTSKVAVQVAVESMRVCHWEVLMKGAQRLTDPGMFSGGRPWGRAFAPGVRAAQRLMVESLACATGVVQEPGSACHRCRVAVLS